MSFYFDTCWGNAVLYVCGIGLNVTKQVVYGCRSIFFMSVLHQICRPVLFESICRRQFKSLPKDKNLNESMYQAFVYDKTNVTRILKFAIRRIENNVGKKQKMLVTCIFSFSCNGFKAFFPSESLMVALQISGQKKFTKIQKKTFFYSRSLLIFIKSQ